MATNTTKGNNDERTNSHRQETTQQDSQDETRLRNDLNDVDSSEEVTPGNVQVPIDNEDKDRQNDVLKKQHIESGFPADDTPRTDEERQRMKEADLI